MRARLTQGLMTWIKEIVADHENEPYFHALSNSFPRSPLIEKSLQAFPQIPNERQRVLSDKKPDVCAVWFWGCSLLVLLYLQRLTLSLIRPSTRDLMNYLDFGGSSRSQVFWLKVRLSEGVYSVSQPYVGAPVSTRKVSLWFVVAAAESRMKLSQHSYSWKSISVILLRTSIRCLGSRSACLWHVRRTNVSRWNTSRTLYD